MSGTGCQRLAPTVKQLSTGMREEPRDRAELALAHPKEPIDDKYTDEIQGTWDVEACLLGDGKNHVPDRKDRAMGTWTAEFKGKTFTYTVVGFGKDTAIGSRIQFSYSLDPMKDPKEMDLVLRMEDGKEIPMKAIYELKGDTLRIAIGNTREGERPQRFPDDTNANGGYFVMKRQRNP